MKTLLIFIILIGNQISLAGGDWMGNGGGKEEIEVYFQLHRLPKYSSEILKYNQNLSIKKIHQDILKFEITSKKIIFVEEAFQAPGELFAIEKGQILIDRKRLWEKSEMPHWEAKEIIADFLKALYRNVPMAPDTKLFIDQLNQVLAENILYPVPMEDFSNIGISVLDFNGQMNVFSFDSIQSINLTDSLVSELRCHDGKQATRLSAIKNIVWRNDLFKIKNTQTKELYSEAKITYDCGDQTLNSVLLIKFLLESKKIQEWSFSQWDIN